MSATWYKLKDGTWGVKIRHDGQPGEEVEVTSKKGETKTVIPGFGGMNTVIDGNGVHTEMQIGNMRQTLGMNGFDWML